MIEVTDSKFNLKLNDSVVSFIRPHIGLKSNLGALNFVIITFIC